MIIDSSMIISGFVSKVVNDCGDILKSKIRDADKNRKSVVQNIETRIYQVIIDAINVYTFDTFKNQDVLYDAAENILKNFKSGKSNNLDAVRSGLLLFVEQVEADTCEVFFEILCHEICKDENNILYKEIIILQQEQVMKNMNQGFEECYKNDDKALKILDDIKDDTKHIKVFLDRTKVNEAKHNDQIHIENRAEEYARKWNKNVFLNDYSERDENAGSNIKLRHIYLEDHLPHYIWKTNKKTRNDLKDLLREYLIENNDRKMLLILGQPGIGKSTLITWIMANFIELKKRTWVFQTATDLKSTNWNSDNLMIDILKTLQLENENLENKILILDGFDELHINDGRERVLNQLYQEIEEMSFLKRFSLIITCRENYVYDFQKIYCDYITLMPWDEIQIRSFCQIYSIKSKKRILKSTISKVLENVEIFGTPLILYMILALNITIDNDESIVDVYDRIFSLEGGSIYDRCISNSRFAAPHRISRDQIKFQIHQISKRIAFWIFENKAEEAYIPQTEYEEICNAVMAETQNDTKEIKHDFLIGNYFKLIRHCESVGADELQFVHRSIYEYFTAVYFYEALYDKTSQEEIMSILVMLLKDGHLSKQILQFIKYKFNYVTKSDFPETTKNIFQIMLRDGMTYYTKEKYKNIMGREVNIFSNMLEIVRLWNDSLGDMDNNIISYIRHNYCRKLNLKGIKLDSANLCRAYLDEANLDEADLNKTNLVKAELNGARLREVKLNAADLHGAFLKGADLLGGYLIDADLRETNLADADLSGAELLNAKLGNANLNGAKLIFARLIKADLQGAKLNQAVFTSATLNKADFRGAELNEIELSGAYLRDAIFDESQIELLKEKYDLSSSKVFDSETNKIISYIEYIAKRNSL